MQYDLTIIGGGPAAAAAGVYAARKQLKTLVIAEEFGGQSTVSPEIQNWIGTVAISGADLAKQLRAHLDAYGERCLTIVEGSRVESITPQNGNFTITANNSESYESKTVLVCSGAKRRKLDVPGAEEFDQKGLTYCASCDGPVFTGMDVVVIGGGNAGFETAAQLLAYTKSVTLLDRGPEFRADPVTVEKVLQHENMTAYHNATILEVVGQQMVTGLKYKDGEGSEQLLNIQGVFVEIGLIPNTELVDGILNLNEYKKIIVDPRTQQTSCAGIWAAGDCSDGLYHQNNIAAGDGVKALEDIYNYLHAR